MTQRRPTSFDIAHLAGVSQPTVSRALRGSPSVNPTTRRRIEEIARQLNYSVDRAASNLRSGETRTIALLLFEDLGPDHALINPFFLSMLGSIMRRCAAAGYDLLISFQDMTSDWHKQYEDSHRADGLLLLGYGDYSLYRARLEALVAQGTHFVRWGSVAAGQPGITVGSDNIGGGYQAARHLIEQGRKRIAFLGDASDRYPEFADRHRGYVRALEESGLAASPALQVDAVTSEEAGADAAQAVIASGKTFDAIVAASDLIAIGAMRTLAAAGFSVPRDVAIVGFDDIPAASLTNPPLTTVVQDARLAGERLVDTLLRRIREEPTESVIMPTQLVVRGSSGAAR
jgi:DNA-binding LacI/PurR family transcriptional regulator